MKVRPQMSSTRIAIERECTLTVVSLRSFNPVVPFLASRPSYPVALVLSPTRELAIQIYEESRKYAYRTGIRTVVVYGGSEVRSQLCELENVSHLNNRLTS